MLKKLLCTILSAATAFAVVFSGCADGGSEATPDTADTAVSAAASPDETSDSAVGQSTDDTAATGDEAAEINWNYSEIKRQSDGISQSFDEIITAENFAGTVYVKVGTVLEYVDTSGFADKDTHTSNASSTRYCVASLTKQFTAAAVMKLKEDGKINIDDTIDKYFPDYKYGEKITVKNLLTMTAGLKDYLDSEPEFEVSENNSGEENKQAVTEWLFEQELNFEPDERFTYSNSAYFLLGDIIEQASGMEYEDYVTENLLKPAGMIDSGFSDDGEVAVGYRDDDTVDDDWTLYDGVGYSAAGLISNVPDLLKWVDALTSGVVISEESFKEMTTAYKGGYGYGLFVSDDGIISHVGKLNKYNSKLAFSSDENYIYIALSNYSDSDPTALMTRFDEVLSKYQY